MAKYKQLKKLSVAEAAYVAGIIDGEGTVTLTRKVRGAQRQLAITISNCEYALLKYIHITLGTGLITKKNVYGEKHSLAFAYRLLNRQALSLLVQIEPYLKTYKKTRAKLVLSEYLKVTPRNGKYSLLIRRKKEKFEKRFFEILPPQTKDRQSGLRVW